ncbi:hypothetical protein MTR67_016116 [Solanum verrucosum]|uniref:RING-type domain-containing protein n=1 Tax=Solanum verrucosum TaxID=315347 RepID=A0AAF0TKF4_SOLVR|nr:hypothetical protein MTR67_016116 [Solanum verrucosum]
MFQLSKIQNLIKFIKWTWDFLLLQSFPHYNNTNILSFKLSSSHDEHCVRCFREEDQLDSSSSSIECAVCLCEIEEGEQVRELRCNHLFHRVCLDRWFGYGRMTCPLCRNNINKSSINNLFFDIYEEVIVFDFFTRISRDRHQWWLR